MSAHFYSPGNLNGLALGPGDNRLMSNQLDGTYSPASRIGEVIIHCFSDPNEYYSSKNKAENAGTGVSDPVPSWAAFSSALPGMVAVASKTGRHQYRNMSQAENSMPVLICANGQQVKDETDYFFAGIVRTRSPAVHGDAAVTGGVFHTYDSVYTATINGLCTILNSSDTNISPGDLIEWTFDRTTVRKMAGEARYVSIKKYDPATMDDGKVFGRALSFARKGEQLDVILM